jgi:DNA-binding IclR family transcriptional regulator
MTLFAPLTGSSDDLDPALLAFIKCHITSPLKWETLRVLANQEGRWVRADELARAIHKDPSAVTAAIAELSQEGVIEAGPDSRCRLLPSEPTTVVLRRLIAATTHNQRLRAVIANHLLRSRHATQWQVA